MIIIRHRVNSIGDLERLPHRYGIEIDVRHDNRTGGIYLNHDPGEGDDLEEYLHHFRHAFIIFNIKEAGIEDRCIALARKHGVQEFFLLDVEFPYIYAATRRLPPVKEIAIRYSEDEPIAQALLYKDKADWVFIDTNTRLPLDDETMKQLKGFKICLVSPERWGRPDDIQPYRDRMRALGFRPDAVMTSRPEEWK